MTTLECIGGPLDGQRRPWRNDSTFAEDGARYDIRWINSGPGVWWHRETKDPRNGGTLIERIVDEFFLE